MSKRLGFLAIPLLLLSSLGAIATGQDQQPKPASPNTDHSREAVVIEKFSCKQRFENDGTSLKEDTARVRIQAEAGVKRYAILTFHYASGTGALEIGYVRVRKPDGTVVETPPENVQDMAAEITREAPFYSDLHEKHVAVKGLSVGDVLEYQIKESTTKPLAPGEFWTSYKFSKSQIVLDEELEISVPRDRALKIKSITLQPSITERDGRRVYRWHSANLQSDNETENKREATELLWKQARGRLPGPDVLLSSFASWDDVGRWYGGLQEQRVKPTAEITAKAAELTKDSADEDAKLRTLYAYVSTQFHYIGIAFGIGRYQPHSAEVVLGNQYGDCKDKHTLLAALLTATGIHAYPALIATSHEVDEDVPSPGQFDHVITVVSKPDGLVWLDTTSEVGPYRYLLSPLRDKHALVIWNDKPPALVRTPDELPYQSMQTFNLSAKLSDKDVLEGNAEFSAKGDVEYLLRAGFRSVAMPQWKDLAQRISFSLGFGGEVSEVTASSPEKTDQPFRFSYKYTRKDFGDWANHRIVVPEPMISLTAPNDEEALPVGPIWLGSISDIQFNSQLELPSGYRPVVPPAVHLKRDFAQYDSTCEFRDSKLLCERHLKTLLREVPVSERELYKEFAKKIQDDYALFVPLTSASDISASTSQNESGLRTIEDLRNLPPSISEEAQRLEDAARDAMVKKDTVTAVSSLYRAVAADPKFTRAWVMLGTLLLFQKQEDAGIDAFHKAMAADPKIAAIPKALGFGLMAANEAEKAIPVWQDFKTAYPEDVDGPANLGQCFAKLNKFSEAAHEFEAAVKIRADRPNLQMDLASAYLHAGEREKAAAAFAKIGEVDHEGRYFNDVAYLMADADLNVPLASDYATRAVRRAEQDSQKTTLEDLKIEQVKQIFELAAFWDTLGWVNYRSSEFTVAEQYLRASWSLTQDGVVAGHLCQVYERTHQVTSAIQMCQLALYRIPLSAQLALDQYKTELDTAQRTLDHLTRGASTAKSAPRSSDVVIRERTFKLPRFLPGTESAEFFVLLATDGKTKSFKVEDTKFISGSDKMKLQGKVLKTINFNVSAPDDVPTRFVKRGILGCYQYSGCSFVLLDPSSVQSVN